MTEISPLVMNQPMARGAYNPNVAPLVAAAVVKLDYVVTFQDLWRRQVFLVSHTQLAEALRIFISKLFVRSWAPILRGIVVWFRNPAQVAIALRANAFAPVTTRPQHGWQVRSKNLHLDVAVARAFPNDYFHQAPPPVTGL